MFGDVFFIFCHCQLVSKNLEISCKWSWLKDGVAKKSINVCKENNHDFEKLDVRCEDELLPERQTVQ